VHAWEDESSQQWTYAETRAFFIELCLHRMRELNDRRPLDAIADIVSRIRSVLDGKSRGRKPELEYGGGAGMDSHPYVVFHVDVWKQIRRFVQGIAASVGIELSYRRRYDLGRERIIVAFRRKGEHEPMLVLEEEEDGTTTNHVPSSKGNLRKNPRITRRHWRLGVRHLQRTSKIARRRRK